MAEENTEQPKKKKNIVKIIIIAVIALILLGGGAIGGLLYMKKQKAAKAEEEETEKFVKKEYVPLERFVTNLRSQAEDGSNIDKFVSIEISFEIKDDDHKEEKKGFLKTYAPMIKNTLLLTIDKFDDKLLMSTTGKQKLAESLKDDINSVYINHQKASHAKHPENLIENILFVSFIIQ